MVVKDTKEMLLLLIQLLTVEQMPALMTLMRAPPSATSGLA